MLSVSTVEAFDLVPTLDTVLKNRVLIGIADDKCPEKWHHEVFLSLTLGSWLLTLTQCCMGSDILAWRSLYARHHEAWRAYYHEMFDYGIREALCCLGRVRYM